MYVKIFLSDAQLEVLQKFPESLSLLHPALQEELRSDGHTERGWLYASFANKNTYISLYMENWNNL